MKPLLCPETVYRRRGHGEEGGVADRPQLFGGAQGDGLGGVVVPFALRPVFQRHEGHPGVLPAAAKAEAVDGENDVGIGFLFGEEPVGDLAAHLGGTTAVAPAGRVYWTMISPGPPPAGKLPGSFHIASAIARKSARKRPSSLRPGASMPSTRRW